MRASVLNAWLLTLLVACSGNHVEERTAVPDAALEALCQELADEPHFDPQELTIVLSTTQPIFQIFALHYVFSDRPIEREEFERDFELGAKLEEDHQPQPVVPPVDGDCRWRRTDASPSAHRNDLVLELSPVIPNPYVDGQRGLFARRSLGGRQGASWYWIGWPEGRPEQSQVVELPIDDG